MPSSISLSSECNLKQVTSSSKRSSYSVLGGVRVGVIVAVSVGGIGEGICVCFGDAVAGGREAVGSIVDSVDAGPLQAMIAADRAMKWMTAFSVFIRAVVR